MNLFILLLLIATVTTLPISPRQQDGGAQTITLVNENTPALIAIPTTPTIKITTTATNLINQQPEFIVPAVIDPSPNTITTTTTTTTTIKPIEEEESSEEDEEDSELSPPLEKDESVEDDVEEEDEEEEEEDENIIIKKSEIVKSKSTEMNEEVYIPGYITDHGELLVPIDTIQRNIQYTIIEDPSYTKEFQPTTTSLNKQVKQSEEDGSETDPIETVDKNSIIFKEPINTSDENENNNNENNVPLHPPPSKPPLSTVAARQPTNEDDELDLKIASGA